MTASITITPRSHWMNLPFMYVAACAVVRVDGVDVAARWTMPLRIELPPGRHEVAVGARFYGMWGPYGMRPLRVDLLEGQDAVLDATNGPFFTIPFTITARGFRSAD